MLDPVVLQYPLEYKGLNLLIPEEQDYVWAALKSNSFSEIEKIIGMGQRLSHSKGPVNSASYLICTRNSFLLVKLQERESVHAPSYRVEVTNEWNCTSASVYAFTLCTGKCSTYIYLESV